jgi:HPt (histidine-containing phosphotransfer) domain-containing protein
MSSRAERFPERSRASAERLTAICIALPEPSAGEIDTLLDEAQAIAHVLAGSAGMFGHEALGQLASASEDEIRSVRERGDARNLAPQPIEALAAALA